MTYGIITGVGTIDRLKKKANNTNDDGVEETIPLKDVFGIQGYWTWLLPIDPVFEDYDSVMGYSLPPRLMREKNRDEEATFRRSGGGATTMTASNNGIGGAV